MNIGTMIPGSQDQADNGIIEKYCYDNLLSNCDIYGGLYQYNEMMTYTASPANSQGICPPGWHMPTDDQFSDMISSVGGSTVAGRALKEEGTVHWSAPNSGATNSSGFTGLPGGYRQPGNQFTSKTQNAYFWTTTRYSATLINTRRLDYNSGAETGTPMNRVDGMSLRCFRY